MWRLRRHAETWRLRNAHAASITYYFIVTAQRASEYCIVHAPPDWTTYSTGTRTEFAIRQLLWFYYYIYAARCAPRDYTRDINFQVKISSPCILHNIENVWRNIKHGAFDKFNKILPYILLVILVSCTYSKIVFFFWIGTCIVYIIIIYSKN